MKKLLMTALAATAMAVTAVPASAQFFAGADESGVGVQVGPLGVGVGPRFGLERSSTGAMAITPMVRPIAGSFVSAM